MEEVTAVLERLGLGKYAESFEDEGFDDIVWMCTCQKDMLREIADECNLAPEDAITFIRPRSYFSYKRPAATPPSAAPALAQVAAEDPGSRTGEAEADGGESAPRPPAKKRRRSL